KGGRFYCALERCNVTTLQRSNVLTGGKMEIRNASDMMSRAQSVGQGCRVTQLYPDGPSSHAILAVDLWEIEPGGFTPTTAQAEEQVMFVISGSGELSGAVAGGPTVVVRKDSVAHIGHREV